MPEKSAQACGGGTLYQKSYQASSVAEAYAENNAENFFLMEYILTYADILFRYLLDAGIPQEQANLIATNALDQLALWVDENCIRKCGYACIRRSESSGYCTLCSYMIQPLACPNKKEVTLRQLGMQEEDLVCMRREFK